MDDVFSFIIAFVWKWSSESRSRWLMTGILHFLSLLLVIITSPFSLFFVLKRCQEYERAVVLGSTLERVNKINSNIDIRCWIEGDNPWTRSCLHSSFPGKGSHYRYQDKGNIVHNWPAVTECWLWVNTENARILWPYLALHKCLYTLKGVEKQCMIEEKICF